MAIANQRLNAMALGGEAGHQVGASFAVQALPMYRS
jgi:hypothetical protein